MTCSGVIQAVPLGEQKKFGTTIGAAEVEKYSVDETWRNQMTLWVLICLITSTMWCWCIFQIGREVDAPVLGFSIGMCISTIWFFLMKITGEHLVRKYNLSEDKLPARKMVLSYLIIISAIVVFLLVPLICFGCARILGLIPPEFSMSKYIEQL